MSVGLSSVGSFTGSFGRMFGMPPTAYRAAHPPAAQVARVPACVVRAYARPQVRTFREDAARRSRWTGSSPPPGRPTARDEEHRHDHIATTQLWVHDQDEALKYWTEKVGFEVRSDVTVPEMGNFRWLTVGPPGSPTSPSCSWRSPGRR